MGNSNSSFITISQNDTIAKSNELIKSLFSVVNECHSCKSKLIKMVSGNHPLTPTGQDDTTPTIPSEVSYINEFYKRQQ